ncbi:Frequency clock protein [Fusarium oxysporum f. sp. albedinis]|nr:Frequency clock protein [Fusarium oxysporum f. sp. albedinis]
MDHPLKNREHNYEATNGLGLEKTDDITLPESFLLCPPTFIAQDASKYGADPKGWARDVYRSGDRVHIQAAFPTDQVFNGRPEDNNHTLSDKHGVINIRHGGRSNCCIRRPEERSDNL